MNESAFQEAIDACRPGSLDHTLPELAELSSRLASDPVAQRRYEAVQAFDRALGAAFEDVPIPAGLADRLLAATMSAETGAAESADVPSSGAAVSLPVRRARTWADSFEWTAPLALVLVMAAVMGVWNYASRPEVLTTEQLVERSFEWQEVLSQGEWNERIRTAPRDEFPLGSKVSLAPWKWQQLKMSGTELVAYYEGPPGTILFVSRSKAKISGLTATPSLLEDTGGWSVGAWQSGDLTYVLLVEGDKRRYESYLKTPAAA